MAERQVTCINKENRFNPNEGITHVGGEGGSLLTSWRMTREEAIAFIRQGNELYVLEDGKRVSVRIAGPPQAEYLTTHPDDTTKNNLLSLPECAKW